MNWRLIFWIFWLVVVIVVSFSLYMYITKAASDRSADVIMYCNDLALAFDSMLLEKGNVTLIYNFGVKGYSVDINNDEGFIVLKYQDKKKKDFEGLLKKEIKEKCFFVKNDFCDFVLEKKGVLAIIKKVCVFEN